MVTTHIPVALTGREPDRLHTSEGTARLRPDGIAELKYRDGAIQTLEKTRRKVKYLESRTGSRVPVPALMIATGLIGQAKDVCPYLLESAESRRLFSRIAVVSGSPVARALASSFNATSVNKRIPYRIFSDEGRATAWLQQQRIAC